MDRSIPHVRDIFAPYRSSSSSDKPRSTEVCVYDYSPGSRRRHNDFTRDDLSSSSSPNDFIDTDHSDSTDTEYHSKSERRGRSPDNRSKNDHGHETRHSISKRSSSSGNHHSSHHQQPNFKSGYVDNHNHHNNQMHRNNQENRVDRNQDNRSDRHKESRGGDRVGDGTGYSSKTLTDRDIRHLERHLSMKKTIRKQISRNLAQAFVEDPKLLENDLPPAQPPTTSPNLPSDKNSNNYSFTLTRAKVAKSEPTFLDMLKDPRREADSGHSSPSHQGGYDDNEPVAMEVNYDEALDCYRSTGYGQITSTEQQPHLTNNIDNKKASFWKKLGFKGKGKR